MGSLRRSQTGLRPGWGLRCHGILLRVAPGQEFTPLLHVRRLNAALQHRLEQPDLGRAVRNALPQSAVLLLNPLNSHFSFFFPFFNTSRLMLDGLSCGEHPLRGHASRSDDKAKVTVPAALELVI